MSKSWGIEEVGRLVVTKEKTEVENLKAAILASRSRARARALVDFWRTSKIIHLVQLIRGITEA